MNRRNKYTWKRWLLFVCAFFFVSIGIFVIWFYFEATITPPKIEDSSALCFRRDSISLNTYQVENSWIKKNDFGLWEMKLSGSPFELVLRMAC